MGLQRIDSVLKKQLLNPNLQNARRNFDGIKETLPKYKEYWIEQWVVACENKGCNEASKKPGNDPGMASVNAYKEGFATVNLGVYRPLRWVCSKCSSKKTNASSSKKNG